MFRAISQGITDGGVDDKNLIEIALNNMVKNFKKNIIKQNEVFDMNETLLL